MAIASFAPTLSRRRMFQGAAAFAVHSLFTGCGAGLLPTAEAATSASPANSLGGSLPNTNPQPVPAGAVTRASMTIGTAPAGTLGAGFVGLSYEKATLTEPLFAADNHALLGLFGLLGPSLLRIGGNSVDRHVWCAQGVGQTPGQIAPADVDALAAFLKAAGWQCLYGINLGGSATGATTPALAAAEVAYVTSALGASLVGIEIGNECENYADSDSFYYGSWSLPRFEILWQEFRHAILSVTPAAPLAGPAAGSNVKGWTLPFGQNVSRGAINVLTQHYYRGPAYLPAATTATLLSPDTALAGELALLKAGAQAIGVPFRITECNSFWSGGQPGVSNAYASSLWAIDMVFQCALGGAGGVNFQGGGQGMYTPIEDKAGLVTVVRPVFYGLLLAAMCGAGTLVPVDLPTGTLNVTAHAVKRASGGLAIVVVNKDAAQHLSLSVALPGFAQGATSATLLQLSQSSLSTKGTPGPDLVATSGVTLQGAGVHADATFTPAAAYTLPGANGQISCFVPALSAVLIEVA